MYRIASCELEEELESQEEDGGCVHFDGYVVGFGRRELRFWEGEQHGIGRTLDDLCGREK